MANRRLAADQKKARRRGATVVFLDETGFLLQPVTRRTWAPRGRTPIQRVSARHDRLSAIGAISLAPRRRAIGVRWKFYDDNIRARDVVAFILHLHGRLRRRLVMVLDRFNVHYAPDDLLDLGDAVVDSLCRQRGDRRIKESYFQTAQLDL